MLLKSDPTVRDAVLEYLAIVVDKATLDYLIDLENQGNQPLVPNIPVELGLIDEIGRELTAFASSLTPPLALAFADWIYRILGVLSRNYSSRGRAPINGLLKDSLQQWLSCRPMRALLDVNVLSLRKLIAIKDAGSALCSLLNHCVKNSPHFDWAVAYIGSVFPEETVSEVLKAGLADFNATRADAKSQTLNTVVGILSHLSGTHQGAIENAMADLFKWSLDLRAMNDNTDTAMQKKLTVPYLSKISNLSTSLRPPFSNVVINSLKPSMFETLSWFGSEWKMYAGSRQYLLNQHVALVTSVDEDAFPVLLLILEATRYSNPVVSKLAEEILELLIYQLEILARGKQTNAPFLDSLVKDIGSVLPLLLSPYPLYTSTAVTIITLIGLQQPSILSNCAAYILLRSSLDEHLAAVVKLSQNHSSSVVLTPAITSALNCTEIEDKTKVWLNITKLFKWEATGTLTSLPVLEAVYDNLKIMSNLLFVEEDIKVAHIITELLRKAVLETKKLPSILISRSIVRATISYFYLCLMKSESIEEMKGVKAVKSMLKKLCQGCNSTRVYAVRELLESSLFRIPSILFGAPPQEGESLVEIPIGLKVQNTKQGHTALMGQRHSSVFHAGIIGSGKRKANPHCPTKEEDVVHNTTLFLKVLRASVEGNTNQETLDGVINISLQLVELISPDVMYNGLPWPEEDFCKVTVERDLYIRRILDTVPIVWHLLSFIAHHRPALCYCSVILRAIVATLMGQWFAASQQGRGPGHNTRLIATTTTLLQIMALGQLLPPPLTALSDVVPKIPPNQVAQILRDCVWNYLRDNVPAPALFTRDANGNMWRSSADSRVPSEYTETLRLVMLNNIQSLGPLYCTLFVKKTEEEDAQVPVQKPTLVKVDIS
ncbi:integrator complex subunit 5 [Nesidiocoris tenuis]|nr:integrator complex subunit 5 [Nesidiocoris tenuis]